MLRSPLASTVVLSSLSQSNFVNKIIYQSEADRCLPLTFFCRSFAFLSVVASREKYLLGLKTSSVATFYVKRAIIEKKVPKNLCIKKETSIFASQLRVATFRAFSSAGLEHLPYKQRVGGSNPSTPTKGK